MSDKIIKRGIGVLFIAFIASTSAYAGTYKWVDQEGNVVYSQHPPAEGSYESIRVKPSNRKPANNQTRSSQNQKFLDDASKQRADKTKLKEEQDKNLELRKKNCDIAKKQLEYFMVQRRKKTEKGEYVNISDSERKERITEANQGIKDYCD